MPERDKKNGRFLKKTTGEIFEGHAIFFNEKGYPCIWINNKTVAIHIIVWTRINGKIPKGHEIHHVDFDRTNYILSNLLLLTKRDHRRIHAGWIMTNGEWTHKPCTHCKKIFPISEYYTRKGFSNPKSLCRKCHTEYTSTKNMTKEQKERRKQYVKNWARKRRIINA